MPLRTRAAVLVALVLLAAAGPVPVFAQPVLSDTEASTDEHVAGSAIVAVAMRGLGAPYRWGGVSPATGFDCSGFVLWVFSHVGVWLPHNETGQLNAGARVPAGELARGDILVFKNTYKAGPSHTGIYIDDGQFIHAVDVGKGVRISDMRDSYWAPRFVAGVRVGL